MSEVRGPRVQLQGPRVKLHKGPRVKLHKGGFPLSVTFAVSCCQNPGSHEIFQIFVQYFANSPTNFVKFQKQIQNRLRFLSSMGV